jgi:hypothetical protein
MYFKKLSHFIKKLIHLALQIPNFVELRNHELINKFKGRVSEGKKKRNSYIQIFSCAVTHSIVDAKLSHYLVLGLFESIPPINNHIYVTRLLSMKVSILTSLVPSLRLTVQF